MWDCRTKFERGEETLDLALFPSRVATLALGVLGAMGRDAFGDGNFWIGGVFGEQAEKGIGNSDGAGSAAERSVEKRRSGGLSSCWRLDRRRGLVLGLLASKVLAFIVYQATPRDPLVLAGVVVAMLVLGLVAAWIPAQRGAGGGSVCC